MVNVGFSKKGHSYCWIFESLQIQEEENVKYNFFRANRKFFSPEVTRDVIDILVVIMFPDFEGAYAIKKKLLCGVICAGKNFRNFWGKEKHGGVGFFRCDIRDWS